MIPPPKMYSAAYKTMILRLCSGARLPDRTTNSCKFYDRGGVLRCITVESWFYRRQSTFLGVVSWFFCTLKITRAVIFVSLTCSCQLCDWGGVLHCITAESWFYRRLSTFWGVVSWFFCFSVTQKSHGLIFPYRQLTAVSCAIGEACSTA